MTSMTPRRRLVVYSTVVTLLIIAVLLAVVRQQGERTDVYTVVAYTPPVCTQDLEHPECGDAVITARTNRGDVRTFHYNGTKRPKGEADYSLATLYEPGAKIEITTSGGATVVQVRHIDQ
jgi:hypothetical protein